MGSEELNNQDDFNAKISDAVDDLFSAVRQIEIDPATNEVKRVGGAASSEPNELPSLDLEGSGDSEPAPAAKPDAPSSAGTQGQELLAKLDQSLMTLDWEVSRSNAGNMRDLLDKAAREFDLGPLVGEGRVISLMHEILVSMSEAPESVPTSGPLALKSSLAALKAASLEGQPYSAETRTLIEQAENALHSVLPERVAPSAAPQMEVAAVAAPPPLPQEFQDTLTRHIARLEQLLHKRLLPVENFFGKTPSLAKLHVVIKSVREQLAEQIDQLKAALAGRYSNVMPVADPVSVSIDLGTECQMLMQFHLQVINRCARRVAPIEKLFADMEGQKKLHAIHFEIRSGLMGQLNYIVGALAGDFGPLPPLPKLAETATPTAAAQPSSPESTATPSVCPWTTLLVGRWRGEHVAFVPEQVCFDGKLGFGAGNIARQQSFKLKKLKSWPWSGLKSKFRSVLAEKSNKELASLEFPLLELPVSASGRDGKNIAILFQDAKGGVVVLDSPLEDLEINDMYEWNASPSSEGDLLCGTISSDFGAPIPVVDISRL